MSICRVMALKSSSQQWVTLHVVQCRPFGPHPSSTPSLIDGLLQIRLVTPDAASRTPGNVTTIRADLRRTFVHQYLCRARFQSFTYSLFLFETKAVEHCHGPRSFLDVRTMKPAVRAVDIRTFTVLSWEHVGGRVHLTNFLFILLLAIIYARQQKRYAAELLPAGELQILSLKAENASWNITRFRRMGGRTGKTFDEQAVGSSAVPTVNASTKTLIRALF